MIRIDFTNFRRRWLGYGRDRSKIAFDPYRDWRRLLIAAALGSSVIIGGTFYVATLERSRGARLEQAATSASAGSLLLDQRAIDRVTEFISSQQNAFNTELGVPPEGVEPSSTP